MHAASRSPVSHGHPQNLVQKGGHNAKLVDFEVCRHRFEVYGATCEQSERELRVRREMEAEGGGDERVCACRCACVLAKGKVRSTLA